MIKLTNDEIELYPKICVCFTGITEKTNYQKILNSLNKYFNKVMIKSEEINIIDPLKMSYIAYGAEDIPTDDDKFEYNWHIFIYDAKENYKKSIKWLEKIYDEEKDTRRKNKISEFINSHKSCLQNSLPVRNKCKLYCKITITPVKKITQKPYIKTDFLDKFMRVNEIIKILNQFSMSLEICTCNYILFDRDKYIIKRMDKTPITTFVDKDDAKNLGNESIDMYASWFENSPIGLMRVIVSKKPEGCRFFSAFKFKESKLNDLLKQCYLKSLKTADIFIEGRAKSD